jgi:putative Holliday junction resolvase
VEILDNAFGIRDRDNMRLMGLDVGSHTIGVAISDELGITAQGLKTIRRKSPGQDLEELTAIIRQFGIGRIVVGLPRNMNGTLGEQAQNVLRWAKVLKKETRLPVVTWDERLSTVAATRILLEADLSRKKRKKTVDKLAAVLILQGFLDHREDRNDDDPHLST